MNIFQQKLFNILLESTSDELISFAKSFTQEKALELLNKFSKNSKLDEIDKQVAQEFKNKIEENFDEYLMKSLLIFISLIYDGNEKKCLSVDSWYGGIDGRDSLITFNMYSYKDARIIKETFGVYKRNCEHAINAMFKKRDNVQKVFNYVMKYLGNGVERYY